MFPAHLTVILTHFQRRIYYEEHISRVSFPLKFVCWSLGKGQDTAAAVPATEAQACFTIVHSVSAYIKGGLGCACTWGCFSAGAAARKAATVKSRSLARLIEDEEHSSIILSPCGGHSFLNRNVDAYQVGRRKGEIKQSSLRPPQEMRSTERSSFVLEFRCACLA